MRILSITAGAAGMYCGSCARDNALAVELLRRGHDVTLLPLYTPTTTDETNVAAPRVLFGGISVYLQQYVPFFRRTPRLLDRLWDSPRVIRAFASRAISTDARLLGDMTVSMLEGTRGVLRKEFDKLAEWLADEPTPDVVNLPNALLIGLAAPLRERLQRPITCTLQGEDLFLDQLIEPYRTRAIELIRRETTHVDRFLSVSDYYLPVMSELIRVERSRISVVPLGVNLAGYTPRAPRSDGAFCVGYFARIAPEKGLQQLAEAYTILRRRTGDAPLRLEAAGYLGGAQQPYLDDVRKTLEAAGLGHEFTYRGQVDRDGKLAFLGSLDVLSVPATYDEPKGLFLLEAMARGVPVVQPRRGAFTEIVEKTGGGLLVAPDSPAALADGLYTLWKDRALAERLGRAGHAGAREHYSIERSTDRLLAVYERAIGDASRRTGSPVPAGRATA
jgi:glycosyltransferase involved in cell wall biosynthesis